MRHIVFGALATFATVSIFTFSSVMAAAEPGTVTPIVYGNTNVIPNTSPKPAQFSVDAPTPKKQPTSVLNTLTSLGNKQARSYCGSSRFRMLASTVNLGLVTGGYIGNGNYTIECIVK